MATTHRLGWTASLLAALWLMPAVAAGAADAAGATAGRMAEGDPAAGPMGEPALAAQQIPRLTSQLHFKRLAALGDLPATSLLQDHQGFIWIGTQNGVIRYNGYEAVRYVHHARNPNSLPNDRVFALYEDAERRIWVGTRAGLARFNPATNDFSRFLPPDGPDNRLVIRAIIGDGGRGMWIATWGGVQHFDPHTGSFRQYVNDRNDAGSLAHNDVNALALDEKGGLWVATWPGGLDYLPPGGKAFTHYRIDSGTAPDSRLNIARALQIDGRYLWIGTEAGVLLWNRDEPWDKRRRVPSPAVRINQFHLDRYGTVWAGTLSEGLLRWDPGNRGGAPVQHVYRANDPFSLPGDNVRAILNDRTGTLWVGTLNDGLAVADRNRTGFGRILPYDLRPGNRQSSTQMQPVEAAPGGRIWRGGGDGLYLFDPASGATVRAWHAEPKKAGALQSNLVYSLYQQPDGPLWIGTNAGLHRLDRLDSPFRTIHFGDVATDFINVIAPGANGRIWLGTGGGVVRYDVHDGSHKIWSHDDANPDSLSMRGPTTLLEDRHGRVWVGSEINGGGLDMIDPGSGRVMHFRHALNDPTSLGSDWVTSLHQDARGRLWVGTTLGLNEILPQPDGSARFRPFRSGDSVGEVKVYAIHGDRRGKLWLSTAEGLMRVDPDSGRAERFPGVVSVPTGAATGLSFADADGALYFGGSKSIVVVQPEEARSTSIPPQVAVTDITVLNRSLQNDEKSPGIALSGIVTAPRSLELAAEKSVLTIEFAALHYADPAKNRYAHRLEGFDREWVVTDAGRRSATYTNLEPGEYVFRVKAANHQGVWSEQEISFPITVLPPYWQTWWFRTLAVTLIAGVVLSAFWVRVRRLKRVQAQLEEQVAARTRELEEMNDKLTALSTTDGLTGITNRRGFDTLLASEWARAHRRHEPLALLLLDVDYFKRYNDWYGHLAGDQCLQVIAKAISRHGRRTSDVVARYGGEEFALLLTLSDAASALKIAEDICSDLAGLALPHEQSPFGIVTVSIGVAVLLPDNATHADLLIGRADRALYRAKDSGRNRALLAGDADAIRPQPSSLEEA